MGAAGTSNGVAWSISPTFIWGARTVMTNTWQGFTGPNFSPALPNSDVIHLGSDPFTLSFAQPIESMLVYVADDDALMDGYYDFGITPTVVSGAIRVNGTRFGPASPTGGIVRLSGIFASQLVHPGNVADGNDFAFVATAVASGSVVAPRPVEVVVRYLEWVGPRTPPPVDVQVFRAGTGIAVGGANGNPVNGQLAFTVSTTLRALDFRASAEGFLTRRVRNVTAPGGRYHVEVTLRPGDVDGDGAVTVFDYDALSRYFDRTAAEPGWTTPDPEGIAPIQADLDGDDAVTVFDYDALSTYFDQVSD